MKSILHPAVYIMRRFKFPKKFLIIGTIFLLPIGLMMYYLISEINGEIEFVKKERIGIEYNLQLKNLLSDLQQHRGMSNALLSGDSSYDAELMHKKSQILLEMKQIDQLNDRFGEILPMKEEWAKLKSQWNEIIRSKNLTAEESFKRHTLIITQLLNMMDDVAYTANLYLDPKAENFDFIYTLMRIPNLTEKIGQARGLGAGIAAKKVLNEWDRIRLHSLSIEISSNLNEINTSLERVLQGDAGQASLMKAHIDKSISQTKGFLEVLRSQLLESNTITIHPDYYFLIGSKAIDSSFALYQTEARALDEQLQKNMDLLHNKRVNLFLVTLAAFLLLLYLFFAFYVSIRGTISSLTEAAIQLTHGDLHSRVKIDSEDELKLVGQSFNSMAESFLHKINELEQVREELNNQKEFSEELILNSVIPTFVINEKHNVTIWNKACETLTGTRAKDVVGTNLYWKSFYAVEHPCLADLIIEESWEEHYMHPIQDSSQVTGGLHSEGWFIMKDGRNRYLSFDAAPIFSSNGKIIAAVETIQDLTEMRRNEDLFKYQAYHDVLTGLPNRSQLDEAIAQALASAIKDQRQMALLFMDLDGFKSVNDQYGHHIGDQLLQMVSQRLTHSVRKEDLVARLGGDEFVILLRDISHHHDAARIAQKLIHVINDPFILKGKRISIGTSIGISLFPETARDNESMLKHADLAMYEAKKNGKNTFRFYGLALCDPNCNLKSCLVWQERKFLSRKQEYTDFA